jgi:hypothetical protein
LAIDHEPHEKASAGPMTFIVGSLYICEENGGLVFVCFLFAFKIAYVAWSLSFFFKTILCRVVF